MFRYNFSDHNETKPYNPVRILEWVLCSTCLILAIYILLHTHPVHIVLKSVFLLVPAAYFFITLADIVVTSMLKPLLWTSWIIFAMMGTLAFFLCTGFLILRLYPFDLTLYSAILIANTATGTVFFFDLLSIISWLINTKVSVVCIKGRPISTASQSTSTSSTLHKCVRREEKANQMSGSHLQFMGNTKVIQCPSDALLRRQKFTCIKDTCPKKCTAPEVPSHGGTFHVSKDVAPVLSPCLLRNIPKSRSCISTPTSSPDSTRIENGQNKYPNIVEEEVTIKSRTVSTSVRMVPKQRQEKNHTAYGMNYIPEENDTRQQGANQCGSMLSRPSSSSAFSRQISPKTSPVQHRCACTYCGKQHQFTATEALTACGDLNNTYKYQTLPTLHEDSSSDEPTKDVACCPCPSPTTSSSHQTSPQLDTTVISRSTLGKTDKKNKNLRGKVESHPSTFCNKRKIYITDADDPNARKSRTIDHRSDDIFHCETLCKNKEIQTQPYKIKRKNDFTCTYDNHDDFRGEPDSCLSKAQRVELLLRNSYSEEDTVLPGAADRSPRNEPSTRNVKHSKQQQPTVIDICGGRPNETEIHLMTPKCHDCQESPTGVRGRRANLRRSTKNCTVM